MFTFPFADFALCVFVGINCICFCDNFMNPGSPSEFPKPENALEPSDM